MANLRKVKVNLVEPIVLDDNGYLDLCEEILESLAEGDEGEYEVKSVVLEVQKTGGRDAVEGGSKDEEGMADQAS